MASTPKQVAEDTNKIINAWQTIAPKATFAGMTFAQYQAKVQPSFDARDSITSLENQMTAAQDTRDDADVITNKTNQQVVNSVKGDPDYGDDSDLYDAMGYTRKSARQSGLMRKKIITPEVAKK